MLNLWRRVGGASLELLEGKVLPGVDALSDAEAGEASSSGASVEDVELVEEGEFGTTEWKRVVEEASVELKEEGGSMMAKMKIDDVDVKGKRVFIRVDFNVPQDKKDPSIITNTARIDGALPTIKP